MDAHDHLSGGDAEALSRHALNRPVAVPDPTPDRGERAAGAWFAVVLRGYDRAQVDARLAELDRRIGDEIQRADAAEAALAPIAPSTAVSLDGTASVAGRDAYELVLEPKDELTLVEEVRIAVDGETSVPLRVQAFGVDPFFGVVIDAQQTA